MMDAVVQDIRYAVRLLLKRPGFTAVAVVTLALGIGANTAIFSVVNAVLLRPLPYPEPERLVTLRSNMSFLNLTDARAQSQSFEESGGAVLQALDYTGGQEPVQVRAGLVTGGLFPVLGVRPALGRAIAPADDRPGGERIAVLSHGFWQRALGGDPGVVGKSLPLSGRDYTVVGVLPPDFSVPEEDAEVWVPLNVVYPEAAAERGVHFLRTFWRLEPGVSIDQAQAEMNAINQRLEQLDPAENKGRRFQFMPLHERVVGNTRPALLVLFAAVAFVLLIACANYANLLLARVASRQHEIVIRAALGAGRGRLVRQVLTESVLLALLGGAAGLLLARWGVDLLLALMPEDLPRAGSISFDGSVLLFTLGVSIATGVVFGMLPAISASGANVGEALKEGGRGATGGPARQRMRNALVVSEIALALVLLIGAGLLIEGFWKLRTVEPGFQAGGVLTMRIDLPESRYKEIPQQTRFRHQILDALNAQPGMRAAMVSEVPLGGRSLHHNFVIEGRPPLEPGEEPELYSRSIGGDYFRTMAIPLLRGRDFGPADGEGAPLVGIVNESFVREYFPNADPVGARVRWARIEGEPQWITIVGVAGDVRHFSLDRPEEAAIYTPYAQSLQPWKRWMSLVVRSDADAAALTERVKSQIWSIDRQIPVTRVQTMTEVVATSMAEQRFNMLLLGIFAGVALVLAAVGIYGVMSYSVSQRTHEIGVRMALGAGRVDVMRMIVRQGMALALLGSALGLAAAFGLTRFLASLLFGVSATDPAAFVAVPVILLTVTLLAVYIPARRATRVDPMVALRYE
jgi:predicted permease